MNRKLLLSFISLFILYNIGISQGIGIGEWRMHTPLNKISHITGGDGKIYGASSSGVLYYDTEDNSLNKLTKVEGLTGSNVADIEYDKGNHCLVIAYANTNVDFIKDNLIINISSIVHSNIPPGQKKLNSIEIIDNIAYLNCGFGVVLLDIDKEEVIDTYYLGSLNERVNVYDFAANDTAFFAATDVGLFYGLKDNADLSFYENWHKYTAIPRSDSLFNKISIFDDIIMVNMPSSENFTDWSNDTIIYYSDNQWKMNDDETFPYGDILNIKRTGDNEFSICRNGTFFSYDFSFNKLLTVWSYGDGKGVSARDCYQDGDVKWLGDYNYGIVKNMGAYDSELFPTNYPRYISTFQLASSGNSVAGVMGGMGPSWEPLYNSPNLYVLSEEKWINKNTSSVTDWSGSYDFVSLTFNPKNEDELLVGSWTNGLFQYNFKTNEVIHHYTPDNSSLSEANGNPVTKVGGLSFAENGDLWITNASCDEPLSVLRANGDWESYSLGSLGTDKEIGTVLIDDSDQKWILSRNAGFVFVFDEAQSVNQQVRVLSSNEGHGNLPGSVLSIAKDQDGEIWLGTDHGIGVIYSPENVFTNSNYDAQPILIPRVDNDSLADILLENNTILSITVDGANNKWIGTANAGVFKVSQDGQVEIHHFTTKNSPLLSNTVMDITINETTGEVFFATVKGIISYKSTATGGEVVIDDEVIVYPNPVRPGYDGPIAIRGLTKNAFFKITDIAGELVYEGQAEGGQAIWYKKNHNGRVVSSGVYMVFSANEDGTETNVAKILVVN